ncbi:MAG TPA: sugar-transfer associated ATP-grasp domain-containing protein [Gemmatimonadales bacterium]
MGDGFVTHVTRLVHPWWFRRVVRDEYSSSTPCMSIAPEKYDIRCSDSGWDRFLFRFEHWLLSPGSTDMGRLRGYLRLKQWRDCRTTRERLHAIRVAMKLPARALRDSWKAIGDYGEHVEREHGVSRQQQLLHLWWIWVRHGVYPWVYYAFQLYRPGQLRRASAFWQESEDDRFYRLLNVRESRDEAELLLDKVRFERWLLQQGLPTVRTLVEFEDGELVRSALPEGRLPRASLFSKPNDSLQGRGTQRWTFDGEGWVGADGRRDEAQLLDELREQSRTEGCILVQEQLRNHEALAPIAPNALSTVRVLTFRDLEGAVRVLFAVCKIPTGDAPTDHMRLGGVAAPVDLTSGRLMRAIGKSKKPGSAPCENHPDTGVRIEGFQLPHWEEVTRLAISAHQALGRMLCIGWDVAILGDGPVIIEGNDNPGHTSTQLPTGIALGETPVVPTLLARLRESFSAERRTAPPGLRRRPSAAALQPALTGRGTGR